VDSKADCVQLNLAHVARNKNRQYTFSSVQVKDPWRLPGGCDEVICAGWDEPEESEQNEVDGMKKGADSTSKVMHIKERLVICNEEDTDDRARMTADEERFLHVYWTEISQLGLTGSENFVGEWEEFIFDAFINLEPVQRSEDECDMRRFRSFNHSTCKTVLNVLGAIYLGLRKTVVERELQ